MWNSRRHAGVMAYSPVSVRMKFCYVVLRSMRRSTNRSNIMVNFFPMAAISLETGGRKYGTIWHDMIFRARRELGA